MTEPVRVVLATHNQHKVAEFQKILGVALPALRIIAYDGPEPVEDGTSFETNALIKARTAAAHTELPALADDSGVCVDVMGGAPGVFSARWSGAHGDSGRNVQLLLDQLADIRDEDRGAHFTATIALVEPGLDGAPAKETVVEGIWPGRIARESSGNNGFGYDPIFIPDEEHVVSARLSPERKNEISHRARAFSQIIPALSGLGN